MMRWIYLLFLIVFLAAIAVFAVQNHEDISIRYLDRTIQLPLSLLIGATYLLGMFSGWTVVGILRRSLSRVTERRPHAG
jgi:uncharacterized integral membrane protein